MEKKLSRIFEIKVKTMRAILDEVEKPSGTITRRLLIDYPHAVAIIPLTKDKKFILVNQHRYAVQSDTIEFPAGKVDSGETPEQAVQRELLEETGYRAGKIIKMTAYAPAMGYSTEIIHMFFATDLERTDYQIDPDEIAQIVYKTKEEVWNIIQSSEVLDPKILIGFTLGEKLGYF